MTTPPVTITEIPNGDILKSKCDALVNPVNCQGIIGAGLALQFKRAYPYYYRDYKLFCDQGLLRIGRTHFSCLFSERPPHCIFSLPTKQHWNDTSQLDWIRAGMAALVTHLNSAPRSVAIPALGCGLGALKWEHVRPIILDALAKRTPWATRHVELYPPHPLRTRHPDAPTAQQLEFFPKKPLTPTRTTPNLAHVSSSPRQRG